MSKFTWSIEKLLNLDNLILDLWNRTYDTTVKMDIEFLDADLKRIAFEGSHLGGLPPQVVSKFREVVIYLQVIDNRLSLYNWKGLRFEKYEGKKNKYTVRLSKKWRLVLSIKKKERKEIIQIVTIEGDH